MIRFTHGVRRVWLLAPAAAIFFALLPGTAPAAKSSPAAKAVAADDLPIIGMITADPGNGSGTTGEVPPAPEGVSINRPVLAAADYRAAKAEAARAPIGPKSAEPAPLSATGNLGAGGNGQIQGGAGGSWAPPDSSGAAGNTQIVQAVNAKYAVYTKANTPAQKKVAALSALMHYTAQPLFDPRVVYDDDWDRWVITAEAFPQSSSIQVQCLAVSKTASATGAYWFYCFNVNFFGPDPNFFYDFPNLGMTQDAVIITANIFDPGFVGAITYGIAKARIYNGLGFSIPILGYLPNTTTPPIVRDQNPTAHLLRVESVNTNDKNVVTRPFFNPQSAFYASLGADVVHATLIEQDLPPNAPQAGTCGAPSCLIDTSDTRFSSQTWQFGNHLWATNTVVLGGAGSFPSPAFYDVNTSTTGMFQGGGYYFATSSSYDFNASIAARDDDRVYVSWNTTLASGGAGSNVQVWTGGRRAADSANVIFKAPVAFTSAVTPLSGNYDPNFGSQRWGDYSNTWPDNGGAFTDTAFAFHEIVNSTSLWGTRFQRFNNN